MGNDTRTFQQTTCPKCSHRFAAEVFGKEGDGERRVGAPHEWGTCRDALDRLLCTYCANHVPAALATPETSPQREEIWDREEVPLPLDKPREGGI